MEEEVQAQKITNVEKTVDNKGDNNLEKERTIEEILAELQRGSILWKVRSYSRWYRRKYYIDAGHQILRYHPSLKLNSCTRSNKIEIDFADVVDIRRGWSTDVFNGVAREITKDGHSRRRLQLKEDSCFSVVMGRGGSASTTTLDLVARNERDCSTWVEGLQHLLKIQASLQTHSEKYNKWLKKMFQAADGNKDGSLSFEECLQLLKQLNVKLRKNYVRKLFDDANTIVRESDREQVLDANEFVAFFHALVNRPEIHELFSKYAQKTDQMTADELSNFLLNEEKFALTLEECEELIKKFEQSDIKEEIKLSEVGFTQLLLDARFGLCDPAHLSQVYQDMTQPLSHYFIASSHNTYLTGNQLSGDSSVEGYIDALKRGCRCVELDCWDGSNDEPIVYHGRTLTSKILFHDILSDAVKPYAFVKSSYPVILSLENHCSKEQQKRLAFHLHDILGDVIYLDDASGLSQLPSPEQLKNRIIIKAKKLPTNLPDGMAQSEADEESLSEESEPDEPEDDDEADAQQKLARKKIELDHDLSDMVNICQAVHFHGFAAAKEQNKCFTMSSFSEGKASKLAVSEREAFIEYNKRQLSRIYPAGKRTTSSNYDPLPFWNVGCQIVALNYQSNDKHMGINDAKFKVNGSCGFILKPDYLRDGIKNDSNEMKLRLRIISGQHIPKPEQSTEGEVVDPYVQIFLLGHEQDNKKYKTTSVRNNGLNPFWNETFDFNVKYPELAILQFTVRDENMTGKDAILGTYAVPICSIQQGYRHVFLEAYAGTVLSPASLFVQVDILQS